MSEAPFEMTRPELEAMHEKFRELKHDINNTLAVIMALSELAQRNPAHYEKLAKAVLTRAPDVVQALQDFQSLMVAKIKGVETTPPAPPAGIF
jgi:two-component sensor histidine kinase